MTTMPPSPPPTTPPTAPPFVPPPAAPAQPPPQKSGCLKWTLIGCSVIIVLGAAAVVIVMAIAFGLLKKTDVYREALHRAQNDPRVIAALGSPVEPGWIVTGTVHVDTNTGGNAEINFSISGPRGKAKVRAVATRENDAWKYEELMVRPESGPPIDLRQ